MGFGFRGFGSPQEGNTQKSHHDRPFCHFLTRDSDSNTPNSELLNS
jgi:hypothetical protein